MQLGLGIDTGGTYTDSVIMDMEGCSIVSRSKALTTRDDLTLGIRDSISGLDQSLLHEVSIVSLSSTLATNSVVEGKSCRVGLICIGKEFGFTVQPYAHAYVSGKFDFTGEEKVPLDVTAVEEALESMRGNIDALAVAGYLSVRNPSHEVMVRDIARRMLDIPVVCAHELTTELGFAQRANTAIVNAGLIPVISDLIAAVKSVLDSMDVDAPLMVVKGDGSVMSADMAMEKPVETILSGPASSLTGAMKLTGLENALVIDIGGTTTDIGVIRDGFPRTMGQGAVIGGHRTRVHAADIGTYGVGGDSRILVNGDRIIISPSRQIPLCVAATKWPGIVDSLRRLADVTDRRSAETFAIPDIRLDTEFFIPASNDDLTRLSGNDRAFMGLVARGPVSVSEASEALGIPVHSFAVGEMESRGYITRIGVTPTDILAASGRYDGHPSLPSEIAVSYLARKCGMDMDGFIASVSDDITRRIVGFVMEDLILEKTGLESLDDIHRTMIDEMLVPGDDFDIRMHVKVPIVGIGAPVASWLPAVAEFLDTELVLPDNHDVGNAVGTITGSVVETAVITVRALPDDFSVDPVCNVFSVDGKKEFPDRASALTFAEWEGRRIAMRMAIASGATDPVTTMGIEEQYSDVLAGRSFRGATVTVRATGKPGILGR